MEDWVKVLLGTTTGFVLGLVSEPIKFWLGNYLKRKQARKLLYYEFARILDGLLRLTKIADKVEATPFDEQLESEGRLEIERFRAMMKLDFFNYYYEKEKPLYYEMRDADQLNAVYKYVRMKTEVDASTPSVKDQLNQYRDLWVQLWIVTKANTQLDYSLLERSTREWERVKSVYDSDLEKAFAFGNLAAQYKEEFPEGTLEDLLEWLRRQSNEK